MRRLPTVFAILACVIHAMVLPWWVASRLPAHFAAVALGADPTAICHGAGANTPQPAPPLPGQQDPNTECPICKGLVGLQVAILVSAQSGLVVRVAAIEPFPLAQVELGENIVFELRNRGPPAVV